MVLSVVFVVFFWLWCSEQRCLSHLVSLQVAEYLSVPVGWTNPLLTTDSVNDMNNKIPKS